MPKVEVTGVTVSHVWDDDSKSDIEIRKGKFDDTGPYVSVNDDGAVIYIHPESWPEIRDQIQGMMDSIAEDGVSA